MTDHMFAFFHNNLSHLVKSLKPDDKLCIKDANLWNRLVKVVRIKPSDPFILFDETTHVTLCATEEMIQNKRLVCGIIKTKEKNIPFPQKITLYLPILKKEALEYAVYAATAVGVQTIVPVITEKSQSVYSKKEHTRLEKIIISACEQAKNFSIPELQQPVAFETLEKDKPKMLKICFDEHGEHITKAIKKLEKKDLCVTLGPEGGFTDKERKALEDAGFLFYKLTSTVLRSREATAIGLGIVRSLLPGPGLNDF